MIYRDRFAPYIVLTNPRPSARWPHASGQNTHGSGLTRAIRAQQPEHFAGEDLKREIIKGRDLRLRRSAGFGITTENKSPRGSGRRRGAVDLAEILGANAYGHRN